MKDNHELQHWLKDTVKLLVDAPDDVDVKQVDSEDDSMSVFTIYSAAADTGKVIGKKGNTIDGIRALASVISWGKFRKRSTITVNDPSKRRDK